MAKNNSDEKIADKKIRLFISYSRRDFGKIEKLYEALSGGDELDVYLDQHDIAAAEDWKQRLDGLIRSSDTILFAVSRDSVASDICQWEIDLATQLNKRIIPVIINDVADEDVPEEIARLNYVFARTDKELIPALQSIGDALKIDIDWIREHTRLADMAHRWEQTSKLGAQPLRGKELEAAEQWLSNQPKDAPAPTELQRKYIYESRKSATKRQRMTVMGSTAAMVIVGVLAGFAFVQRNAAIESETIAEQKKQEAEIQRNIAVENEAKATAALNAVMRSMAKTNDELIEKFYNTSIPKSTVLTFIETMQETKETLRKTFGNTNAFRNLEAKSAILSAEILEFNGDEQGAHELASISKEYYRVIGEAKEYSQASKVGILRANLVLARVAYGKRDRDHARKFILENFQVSDPLEFMSYETDEAALLLFKTHLTNIEVFSELESTSLKHIEPRIKNLADAISQKFGISNELVRLHSHGQRLIAKRYNDERDTKKARAFYLSAISRLEDYISATETGKEDFRLRLNLAWSYEGYYKEFKGNIPKKYNLIRDAIDNIDKALKINTDNEHANHLAAKMKLRLFNFIFSSQLKAGEKQLFDDIKKTAYEVIGHTSLNMRVSPDDFTNFHMRAKASTILATLHLHKGEKTLAQEEWSAALEALEIAKLKPFREIARKHYTQELVGTFAKTLLLHGESTWAKKLAVQRLSILTSTDWGDWQAPKYFIEDTQKFLNQFN